MISNLIKKSLLNFKPYTCARDLYSEGIFFDANENAFGSMVKIPYKDELNRYPDPYCILLKKNILKYLDLPFLKIENIFVGSGSDEIIRLLINLFVDFDEEIVVNVPTYGMYKVAADIAAVKVKEVELDEFFQLDLRAINKAITPKTKLIFCCSPNNPTGNLLDWNDICELCEDFKGVVVLDEAYVEFSSRKSMAEMIERYPNLLILRTLSKAWGLAGLRLGYMMGNDEIVGFLNKIKLPYNVNSLSQSLAVRALNNKENLQGFIERISDEREWLKNELIQLGFEVFPSEANFLLIKVGLENCVERIVQNLAKSEGLILRDFSANKRLKKCFRVTVGIPKQNRLLIQSLTSLL